MSKQIAKLLKADLNSASNLALIAKMLEKKGRANDTILAHISSKEAKLLKELGGSGTVNPETGLLEFYDIGFGEDVYSPPDASATSVGPSPSNAQIEAQNFGDVSAPQTRSFTPLPQNQGTQSIAATQAAEDLRAGPTEFGTQFPLEVPQFRPAIVERPDNLQESLRQQYAPEVARTDVVSRFDQPADKSFLDKLSNQDLIRLGLAGGLGALGYTKSQQAKKQAEQAAAEQKALAQPYQTQGQELVRAAQSGELSPTGQQSLQALQARLAQGVESRGGVGAQQAAAQAEAYRQQLLQTQYNLGLQVSQIGDSIALGAIKTGLQADQQMQTASTNFYTQLAMIGAGIPMYDQRTGISSGTRNP